MVAKDQGLIEGLESKKFSVFSGPCIDPDSNVSAQMVAQLRQINVELEELIKKLESRNEER